MLWWASPASATDETGGGGLTEGALTDDGESIVALREVDFNKLRTKSTGS